MSIKRLNAITGEYNKFHSDKQKKKVAIEAKEENEPYDEELKEKQSGDPEDKPKKMKK